MVFSERGRAQRGAEIFEILDAGLPPGRKEYIPSRIDWVECVLNYL